MKVCLLAVFVLCISITCSDLPEDFTWESLDLNRITITFSLSVGLRSASYDYFKASGFTSEEARLYSAFVGIIGALIWEFATNPGFEGLRRENSLLGIGASLIIWRF